MNKSEAGSEGLEEGQSGKNPEFEAFEKNLTEILKVPKTEIDKREKEWKSRSKSIPSGRKNTSKK